MINVGTFSGIFIPIINSPIPNTAIPPNIFNAVKFRKFNSFGPIPAAKITKIVAIIPAINAASILCFTLPSNNTAVKIAAGPAMNRIANANAFSNLNKPLKAAKDTEPFKLPSPNINASFFICFDNILITFIWILQMLINIIEKYSNFNQKIYK